VLTVASWNINSIRARLDRLVAWLERRAPDVVCLQEIKVTDAEFPLEEIERAGYRAAVHGQKTYNGVAILSRRALEDVVPGLGDDPADTEARLIAGTLDGVRVLCAYVPLGTAVGSEGWVRKLEWLARLRGYLERRHTSADRILLCGDLNVAPEDRDVARPEEWRDTVLCHQEGREALRRLIGWGLVDTVRLHHEGPGPFSWWDYRQLAFPRGNGLRLDHILATRSMADRCTQAYVDRDERKGKKPSDHAPVVACFRA
jgi:exodeoxyribonuclease-3